MEIFGSTPLLPENFSYLADILLNKTSFLINKQKYRLIEIEFYYRNEEHNDEYVHSHPNQKEFGVFYFHRFHTNTYKGGTFKGLDIALGSDNTYFGILIRSIQRPDGIIIEGSCNIVTEILSQYQVDSILELTKNQQLSILSNDIGLILQRDDSLKSESLYKGPRVGLSDKYPAFKNVKYRFLTHKDHIKKQKKDLVLCKCIIECI